MEDKRGAARRCMICGGTRGLLREDEVLLCSRCVMALGRALQQKLGLDLPDEEEDLFPQSGSDKMTER